MVFGWQVWNCDLLDGKGYQVDYVGGNEGVVLVLQVVYVSINGCCVYGCY